MATESRENKELYIYPAIFTYEDETISIDFPDLPGCSTFANNDEEAVFYAKEVLSLTLCDLEEDGSAFPKPTPISKININKNQHLFAIDVWMPYHRAKIKTYSVKKTLTIPNWLNVIAEKNNINFSQVLQNALMEQLHLSKK